MKRADLIIAIAAFIVATLAAFGMYLLLKTQDPASQESEKPKEEIPMKEVLVASKNIELGESIVSAVRLEKWPESSVHPGFFSKEQAAPEKLKTFVARRAIVTGEPITENAVLDQKDHGVLAALLGAGMRALSVAVDPASLGGGLVLPGDIVDIILAYGGSKPGEEITSRTILCGVRVLAFDQRLGQAVDATGKKIEPPAGGNSSHTVTLEVTPDQAEILASAIKMGALTLSLRSTSTAQEKDCVVKPLKDDPSPEDKAAKDKDKATKDKLGENTVLEDKIKALEEKLKKKKPKIEIFRASTPTSNSASGSSQNSTPGEQPSPSPSPSPSPQQQPAGHP